MWCKIHWQPSQGRKRERERATEPVEAEGREEGGRGSLTPISGTMGSALRHWVSSPQLPPQLSELSGAL